METSPFSKLPAELRLEIYGYVLSSPDDDGKCTYDHQDPKLPLWLASNNRRALTAVSSQMRTETSSLTYDFRNISSIPLVLNRYEPPCFHHSNREKVLMLWKYLSDPSGSFSARLEHLGDKVKTKIQQVEVCIGTWNVGWVVHDNVLIEWLTRNLARLVQSLVESDTQISLCFNFDYKKHRLEVKTNVALSISDIATAYRVFEDSIENETLAVEQKFVAGRHVYVLHKFRQYLNQCRVLLNEYLHTFESQIGAAGTERTSSKWALDIFFMDWSNSASSRSHMTSPGCSNTLLIEKRLPTTIKYRLQGYSFTGNFAIALRSITTSHQISQQLSTCNHMLLSRSTEE